MTTHHGAGLSVRGESEDADQLGQSDHLHPPVPVFSDPSGEIAPCRIHRAQTGRELQLSWRRTPDRHKSRGLYGFFSNQSDSNNKLCAHSALWPFPPDESLLRAHDSSAGGET